MKNIIITYGFLGLISATLLGYLSLGILGTGLGIVGGSLILFTLYKAQKILSERA